MVSALAPSVRGSGSSPGRDTMCCALGQDTQLAQCLAPPRSLNGYQQTIGEPNKLQGNDLQGASILSRGSRNTPGHFMPQIPG